MQGSGPLDARVMVIGDMPDERDEQAGMAFAGNAGYELDRQLHEVGLLRTETFTTNVLKRRASRGEVESVFRNDRKKPPEPDWTWSDRLRGWAHPSLAGELASLDKEIALIKPTVIVAMGNLALQAVAGQWSVAKWRGSLLKGPGGAIVVPCYHPGLINRNWAWRMYSISDLRRVARIVREGMPTLPNYRFIIRPNFETATSTLQRLLSLCEKGPTHISCDIETRAGHTACLGLGWSKTEAICIPLMDTTKPEGYWSLDEEVEIVWMLQALLTHPNCHVSGQNFSYDTQYIYRHFKFIPNLSIDTMLTHHVMFPGTEKGLDVLSSLYCDYHVYWKDDRKEWPKGEGEAQLWSYNCMDCVRTWEIAEVLLETLPVLGFVEQAAFQHRMYWHALETMIEGVRVDANAKRALSIELQAEKVKREKWIEEVLGHPFNVRSNPQMQKLFYHDFGLKPIIDRKSKSPTLKDEALAKLAGREPLLEPLIRRIQEIRSLGVFRSTFVEARTDYDGRMRCSYNVGGTETFRFSSSKNPFGSGLNLQNIPEGGEDDDDPEFVLPNVRKLFLPDEECETADMDLASADLRIVVAESGEMTLQEMLDAGLNPYVELAKEYYHDSSITKAHSGYRTFKSLAHGTNYLGTARGLAGRLGLRVKDVEATQEWYFARFPKIREWQKHLCKQLETKRFVANRFGYRRFYFDRIEGTLYNQAVAWIPQSTVGLLINKVWDRVRTEEPWIKVRLQVHDSLVFCYPIKRAEEAREKLPKLSRIPVPYPKPLIIPTGFKTSRVSWGHCA